MYSIPAHYDSNEDYQYLDNNCFKFIGGNANEIAITGVFDSSSFDSYYTSGVARVDNSGYSTYYTAGGAKCKSIYGYKRLCMCS